MSQEGAYSLSNVRLMQGDQTILEAKPLVLSISCLGEILISSVTSTPMTGEEIRDAGLQLGAGSYEARRFTMALSIGSRQVNLSVPVATPLYNGLEDPRGGSSVGRLDISGFETGDLPDLSVVAAEIKPEKDPFNLSRPAVSHTLQHGFKALLVIPGSIGYLHQHYRVSVVVLNTLQAGSPFKVTHLTATYSPPTAGDGVGALKLVPKLGEGIDDTARKSVRGNDAQGSPGKGEDTLAAGESGLANFYVEGLKEGSHPANFLIQGQFEGPGLDEAIPLKGTASGRLLVKNPTFDLLLVHPDVVRKGEVYTLEARLTNSSSTFATGISLSIDQARLGNVKLVSAPVLKLEEVATNENGSPKRTLNPGETASFKFQLRAMKTGEVQSSYLYIEEGTMGFQLSTGIGERNIRLNPDTLCIPQTLEGRDGLPEHLREAMLRVLGQAYSVATTKGALPLGVLPISRGTVTEKMAQTLSEQGVFLKMGTDRARIWWELWSAFTRNSDAGFDQLVRTTEAGAELRSAFLEAWRTWADTAQAPADRLKELASFGWGVSNTAMAALKGAKPGLSMGLVDDAGRLLQNGAPIPALGAAGAAWGAEGENHLLQFPMLSGGSARMALTNQGSEHMDLDLALLVPTTGEAQPIHSRLAFRLGTQQTATLELGPQRQLQVKVVDSTGTVTHQGVASNPEALAAEPFQVLAVHRYDLDLFPDATPYGTHVMVLFNRPNKPITISTGDEGFNQAQTLIQVEGNAFWRKTLGNETDAKGNLVLDANGNPKRLPSPPALIQAYSRVLSLYLEKPVGPYIQRQITLADAWQDIQGNPLSSARTWPIQSGLVPGGAIVKGHVRKLDGTGIPARLTYWYYTSVHSTELDLATGQLFAAEDVDTYYALVTNNVATESDGAFQLDYVPEPVSYAIGPFLLQGNMAEGTAFAQASVLGNGQVIQMDLVLEGKGSIEGYTLDAQGIPVPGVQVQAIQEQQTYGLNQGTGGGSFSVSGVSDAQGYYRLDGLKTGVFSIRALKDLFGVAGSGEIARDGEVVRKDLVLKGKVGSVKVRLLDLQGASMLKEWVRMGFPAGLLRSGSGTVNYVYPEQATADGDGWVRFKDVPSGDIHLLAPFLRKGTVTEFHGYLEPGAELVAELRQLPAQERAKAQVLVVDTVGAPVANAFVKYSGSSQYDLNTDEQGLTPWFELAPGQSVTVQAYHPAWVGNVQGDTLIPEAGQRYTLRVVMPAKAGLKGTVTRPDGTPVKGAYVAIPPVYDDMKKNRLGITDAKGAFQIPDVPVGNPFRFAAVGPELRTAITPLFLQLSDGETRELSLVLPAVGNNTLQGTVYQPQEGAQKIPAMAQVWVMGFLPSIATPEWGNGNWGLLAAEEVAAAQTPATGAYRFTGLPSGAFTLKGNSDFFPVIATQPGTFGTDVSATQTMDLTLISSFAGELKGRVVGRDGATPVAKGARVSLIGGSIGDLTVLTQENGIYKFAKVIPAGKYKLRVEDPVTGDFCIATIEMKQEESQARNLRLWGRGNLQIHVQDNQGLPLAEAEVEVVHSKNNGLLGPYDLPELKQKLLPANGGEMLFEDLLEGPITVIIKNPTGLRGTASVELPVGGGNAEVTVKLQAVGGIRGILKRSDGTLVPSGRVDAYGQRGGDGNAWLGVSPTYQEGVEGRFLFYPLPAGVVRLEAWDPDTRQIGRITVNVAECTENGPFTEVEITCQDKGPVTLKVVDEAQTPVLRASLSVRYTGGPALSFSTEATTDAEGKAGFVLPPGDYFVEATDPITLATGSLAFSRAANQGEFAQTLTLKGVRSIFATVLPPPGAPTLPLSDWQLRINGLNRTATLNDLGQATLQDVPIGSYTISLTDLNGKARGTWNLMVLKDGNAIQDFQAQAQAMGSVTATVKDPEGAAVPGVDVWLSGLLWSSSSLKTDLNGTMRFLNVSQGQGTASINGGSSATFTLETEGQDVPVSLTTAPSGQIHGLVTDPGGQPVPYAAITAYYAWGGGVSSATDGTGHFAVKDLPIAKPITIRATTGAGRQGHSGAVTLSANNEDLEVNFALSAQGSLTGRFTDVLRPQLPPLQLRVSNASGILATSTTDTEGKFQIGSLPAGESLTLTALWDDGVTQAFQESFTIASEGETVDLTRPLPAFVNLKGWTKDSDGNKIPMTVILRDAQGKELNRAVTTGDLFDPDHPTFFFRYLRAGQAYRLDGCRERTTTVIATLNVVPVGDKEMEELVLQQPSPRTLRMAVVYPDGSAVPGPGHVVLTPTGIYGGQWQGELDAAGTATVTDLPTGPFRVQVSAVPNQPTLEMLFEITAPTGQTQELQIPAMGVGSVSLSVKTASGRTLSGSSVSLSGSGTPTWSAQAQQDGSWLVSGLWIGRALSVQATGFGILGTAPAINLTQHGQNLPVVYPAPDQGALAGTVKDSHGSVVAGARVEVVGKNFVATTDASGAFRFEPLVLGSYTLSVTLPGRPNRAVESASLSGDAEVHLQDLALKGTGTVRVNVLKEDGSPNPGQTISLKNTSSWSDGQSVTVLSDASGVATFSDVLEGSITASATLDSKARSVSGTLSDGGTLTLELRSKDMSRVSGRVRRASDLNNWSMGAVATIQGFTYTLQTDGTLVPPSPEPLLNYTTSPVPVQVVLSSGATFAVGTITLVKNDVTPVELRAPAFGAVQGVVRDAKGALVASALVSSGTLSATTDAQGAYRLEGLVTGSSTLSASLTGRPNRAVESATVAGDGSTYTLNLTLKGTGTVTVKTLATDGSILANQAVTLRNNSAWSAGNQLQATSDAQGLATFTDVLEGSITASATLDSLSCSSSGTLAADQTLALTLQPRPYSTISGQIKRANATLTWPQGTRLLVSYYGSQFYNLAEDGTIQVPAPNPHLDYNYGYTSAYVVLPGGRQLSLGNVTLVKNGDTVLNLTAPGFGSLSGTVKDANGNPVSGVNVNIDGSSIGTTNATGAWSKTEIPTGSRHITASTSTSIAAGDVTLAQDGGTANLDLTLLSNSVSLYVRMAYGRLDRYAFVYADGTFSPASEYAWDSREIAIRPWLKVDGAAEVAPAAPGGIAQWLEKGHQISYTTTVGSIEVTLVRTVAPGTSLSREEIRLRNTDTASHSVSLRHAVSLSGYRGFPSTQSQPVLSGDSRDKGVLTSYGTILWGNGADAPLSLSSGGFQWPEWTLAAGEQKTLALAFAPYRVSEESTFRPDGAGRLLDRILHGAPEWVYGGNPSAWSNWLPTQAPEAEPLAAWDASATLTLKDHLGRTPVNAWSFNNTFEAAEKLAPKKSFSSGNPISGLPGGGGIARVKVPGYSSPLVLTRTLNATQSAELTLEEAAPVTVKAQDAHGVAVAGASVYVTYNGSYASNSQGMAGPWLLAPETYSVQATLPGSDDTVQVSGTILALAGTDNTLTLAFPAVGSVKVSLLGADGLPFSASFRGYLIQNSTSRSKAGQTALTWTGVLPGEWRVRVVDPRTGGYLQDQTITVSADAQAEATFRLPSLGQVRMQILTPAGTPVARGQYVYLTGADGGTQVLYTDDAGLVTFSNVAPGNATITATNPGNGYAASVVVTVTDGTLAQATLALPGAGNLVVNVKTADGRPVGYRYFQVMDGGNVSRYGSISQGTGTLSPLPSGRSLVLRDITSYYSSLWSPLLPEQTFTLAQDGDTKTLNLILPLGGLTVKVQDAAGNPIPNATVSAGGGEWTGTTAQDGTVLLSVPLDTPFAVTASFSGYMDASNASVTVSTVQPTGTITLTLAKTIDVNFHVKRANGSNAPYSTYYARWTLSTTPATTTRTLSNPSGSWKIGQSGTYTFEAMTTVGTDQSGSWSNQGYNIWPWKATATATLDTSNPTPTVTATLPALAAFTLHPKAADGSSLAVDRYLKLILKNSTAIGFLPNLPAVGFNPRWISGNLVMEEHFPEGTHSFAIQDRTGITLSTFDLVVRPEDDATRIEKSQAVTLPALASLTLHYQDAQGRPLVQNHNLQLRLVQSTAADYAPSLSAYGNDPAFGQDFPEGTHTFAVVDPAFGEMARFDLTVGSGDDGKVLERTLQLPYVRSTWTLQALAGDGITPAVGAELGVYATDFDYGFTVIPGELSIMEVPDGTVLRGYGSYRPYGKDDYVVAATGDQVISEGTDINQILSLDLTVLRVRLLETDGTDSVDSPGCDLPDITDQDSSRQAYEWWDDGNSDWAMLILGQDPGATLKVQAFDGDSGLGKVESLTVPALGSSLAQEIRLPEHGWLETVEFRTSDGSTPEQLAVAISADAPGLVRPDLAIWQGFWDASGSFTFNSPSFGNAWLSESWSNLEYRWNYNANTSPSRVRVPLGATLWMGSIQNGEGGYYFDAWGSHPYTVAVGETLVQPVAQTVWQEVPCQVVDSADQLIRSQNLACRQMHAPDKWTLEAWAYRDASSNHWSGNLPLGMPLHLELQPLGCGSYWKGSWDHTFDASTPAPGPVFKATEWEQGEECPPV
ncbi:MAG: LamG domain protein jellyroll fold domain protein [Holophagaceae bacterium]|nr:LamG domain protein jellyroll fold domain protein [Holophagaceae bacterium]